MGRQRDLGASRWVINEIWCIKMGHQRDLLVFIGFLRFDGFGPDLGGGPEGAQNWSSTRFINEILGIKMGHQDGSFGHQRDSAQARGYYTPPPAIRRGQSEPPLRLGGGSQNPPFHRTAIPTGPRGGNQTPPIHRTGRGRKSICFRMHIFR